MDELFGLSMNTIMYVLLGILGVAVAAVGTIFVRNRIIFLMGLRNIPRRMSQTVLIIIGLMLSTVIITAAFTTGDTVDYSITKQMYDLTGHTDIVLDGEVGSEAGAASRDDQNIDGENYRAFLAAADAADLQDVDGYTGLLVEAVPTVNDRTSLSEPDLAFVGVDAGRLEGFPDVIDSSSGDLLDVGALGDGEVYLNEDGADELDAEPGDTITVYVFGEPQSFTVVAIVESTLIGGATDFAAKEGLVARLDVATEVFGEDAVTVIAVSATGRVRDSLAAAERAEVQIDQLIRENGLRMEVSDTKPDLIDEAEQIGNFMTTFFLLLGLFSIASGTLLIVMIFVMLAAERKSEMGMSRAVGMKRRHLIEMFLAEGMSYDLMSAMVGVVLGVLVAFLLAIAASSLFSTFGFTFTPHVTLRTMVVSACLGAVLTFITVGFSSWRISNLNIVRAIRDIPDPTGKRMGWRGVALWVLGILFAGYLIFAGLDTDGAFAFMLGVTIISFGLAVFGTYFGVPPRPAYTTVSLFLLITWALAAGGKLEDLTGPLDAGEEMFFLSGVAMVTASTFLIIYNSDILLAALSRVGNSFGSILPSLRTAIAYPMANRFRTGMTLAMISLVVFALTTMSAMNLNYDKLFLKDESRGGWDIQVVENPNNPVPSVRTALQERSPELVDDIAAEGAVLNAGFLSATEVAQGDEDFDDYSIQGLSDGFLDHASVPLSKIANGYDDADAVWQALRTEPDVAIVDGFVIEGGFGPSEFALDGVPDEDRYDAPTVTVQDATTGERRDVRVIGIISFGASSNFYGFYMGEEAWREIFGEPELSVHYLALGDPGKSTEVAQRIESALVTSGAQSESLRQIAAENNALSRGFLYLMQAFMGLGLFVGVAAVGVIAFRTVVERRQQIGMLRAIGYKKSQVSLSFMMESSFVTIAGVASGTFLGLWLALFLVTSDDFPGEGNTFYVPWLEIAVINTLTIVASLLMTLIPSRQAASVPTAEALRYE